MIAVALVVALFLYVVVDVFTEFGVTRNTWCRALGHRWDRPGMWRMCKRCTLSPALDELEQQARKEHP